MGIVFIILIYSIFTMDLTIAEQNVLAQEQTSASSNWILGALLYVSYNIAAGTAMLIVMGNGKRAQDCWFRWSSWWHHARCFNHTY